MTRPGEQPTTSRRTKCAVPRPDVERDARPRKRHWMPAISEQVLPSPTTEAWSWLLKARCRGTSADVFFAADGERPDAARQRQQQAISCCMGCEVVWECRDYALTYEEPWGVWGGLSESERQQILDSRGRRRRRRPGC